MLKRREKSPIGAEVDRLFDRLIHKQWNEPSSVVPPKINMREDEDGYTLEIEMPGVCSEDVSARVEGNLLSVEGRKKRCDGEKAKNYLYSECSATVYRRVLLLPAQASSRGYAKSCENGVLKIRFSKKRSSFES